MERGMAVLSHRNMTTLTYRGKKYVQNKEAAKKQLVELTTEETYTPTEWMTLLQVMKKQN